MGPAGSRSDSTLSGRVRPLGLTSHEMAERLPPGSPEALLHGLSQDLTAMVEGGEPVERIAARQKVKLRCSKCRRTLDVVESAGHKLVLGSTPTSYRKPSRPGPRPSITKLTAINPAGVAERYVFLCHRRCCDDSTRARTQHVLRPDHLVAPYVRAVRAGVDSLYLPLEKS